MTRTELIRWLTAVFIVIGFMLFGCTGITDTPPQDPPYCTYDGYTRICDGDTVKVKMLGTANNALGARGME